MQGSPAQIHCRRQDDELCSADPGPRSGPLRPDETTTMNTCPTHPTFLSRCRRLAVRSLLPLCVLLGYAHAQPATGSISGRVHNEATGQYLNNARVTVKGTDLTAFTDETGTFRIGGVPAGSAIVEAFYSGLDPLTVTVPVSAGQNSARDINLTNKAAYGDKAGSTVKLWTITVRRTETIAPMIVTVISSSTIVRPRSARTARSPVTAPAFVPTSVPSRPGPPAQG